MDLPERTDHPGWPEFLKDVDDIDYVRLRDGSPFPVGPVGSPCLYGRVFEDGYIDRTHQYQPDLNSMKDGDDERTVMASMPWTPPEQLEDAGAPIVIPDEPVEVPGEEDRRWFRDPD